MAERVGCVPPPLCRELVTPTGLHFLVCFSLMGCDSCAPPGPRWLRHPASLSHLLATRPGQGDLGGCLLRTAQPVNGCGEHCTLTASAALDFIISKRNTSPRFQVYLKSSVSFFLAVPLGMWDPSSPNRY